MIGVVVSARVQPARAAEFEEGVAQLMRVAATQPGRISADVLRGTAGPGGRDYHVVYRFADEASLRAWEASPERWRMALLTWVGIWPLVSLSLWLIAPHLAGLPFLLQTALNSALLVLAMTYLVMPWLARLAAPLLDQRRH